VVSQLLTCPDTTMQIHKIESDIRILNNEIFEIVQNGVNNREGRDTIEEKCKKKHEEISKLQEKLNSVNTRNQIENAQTSQIREMLNAVDKIPNKFTEYDDELVRKIVTRVKIVSKEMIEVTLLGTITLDIRV